MENLAQENDHLGSATLSRTSSALLAKLVMTGKLTLSKFIEQAQNTGPKLKRGSESEQREGWKLLQAGMSTAFAMLGWGENSSHLLVISERMTGCSERASLEHSQQRQWFKSLANTLDRQYFEFRSNGLPPDIEAAKEENEKAWTFERMCQKTKRSSAPRYRVERDRETAEMRSHRQVRWNDSGSDSSDAAIHKKTRKDAKAKRPRHVDQTCRSDL